MAISASESQSPPVKSVSQVEVECVKCDSCGFTEECTLAYITRVRQRYQGRWLCGLCVEAVKHEVVRSDSVITMEEALDRHISFCREFRSSSVLDETEHPIFAMGRLLRRSLDSPKPLRSNSTLALPSVPPPHLLRSESCFSSISELESEQTKRQRKVAIMMAGSRLKHSLRETILRSLAIAILTRDEGAAKFPSNERRNIAFVVKA
ncbi:hypothetical protein VNO78_23085 [Psophocarpus tetragonolobus]|uniref:DUF1677 family protein n=1 Tax=Psophocarpus tetragonolobus TaxID=3891 RepID=A0AAN9XDD3_PSOTE